jgi:hypothetical protein
MFNIFKSPQEYSSEGFFVDQTSLNYSMFSDSNPAQIENMEKSGENKKN